MHLGHVLKFAHDHGATTLAHVETILREHLGLRLNQIAVHHPALDGITAGGSDQAALPTAAPAVAPGEIDYDRLAKAIVNQVAKGIEKVTAKVVPNAMEILGTVLALSGGEKNGNYIEKLLAEQQAEEARIRAEDEARAAAASKDAPSSSDPVPDNVVTLPPAAPPEPSAG